MIYQGVAGKLYISAENDKEIGNPKGKAVEHFTNMLAEMRSYGQGVIVAEQIPSKLAPEVIKNSSNKIIHRIVSKDDQEVMANTIGVHSTDAIYLGNSRTGYALCHKEGMVQPVIVKFDEVTTNDVRDIKLFEEDDEQKVGVINRGMIMAALHREILACSTRALLSMMYCREADGIDHGCAAFRETLARRLIEEGVTLIPERDVAQRFAECVCDGIGILLAHGVFSASKIPEDALMEAIRDIIESAPTPEKLETVKTRLSEFYYKDARVVAIEITAGLCIQDYKDGKDLAQSVPDYLLVPEWRLYEDVMHVYERMA